MAVPFQVLPGAVVGGDFRVVRALSAGGMGAVYIAEQISTGKRRALKVMLPQLVEDPKLRERFAQEARVGALIQSEHVVEVIAAGIDEDSGAPWIAMELLQGRDLGDYTARRGGLEPREVREVLRQLCHALAAAHDAGVVHRDIKPENVFVARTKSVTHPTSVKVLDFGIAKVAAAAKTTATARMGSPVWMAPEQTDPAADITAATDVWAVGLMSFWLLTGRCFWRAGNDDSASMHALMREILIDPIPKASERAAELGVADQWSTEFDAWFACCAAREPELRFENVRELYDGFELAMSDWLGDAPTSGDGAAGRAHSNAPPASSLPPPSIGPESITSDRLPSRSPIIPQLGATDSPTVSTRQVQPRRRNRGGIVLVALLAIAAIWFIVKGRPGLEWAERGPAIPIASFETPETPSAVAPPQPTASALPSAVAPTPIKAPKPKARPLPPFDEAHVRSILLGKQGAARNHCQSYDGSKIVHVTLTWTNEGDLKNMYVVPAAVGDARATCVKGAFLGIRVLPFSGPEATLGQAVIFD